MSAFVLHETAPSDPQGGLSITDDPQARRVPPILIPDIWHYVAGKVAAALRYAGDTYRLDDAKAALLSGEWQLWGDGVSVICTRIAEYPASRTLFVMLASGDLESIKAMWPDLARFGRENGCTEMTGFARPGWRRSGGLPQGWRHVKDVITVGL